MVLLAELQGLQAEAVGRLEAFAAALPAAVADHGAPAVARALGTRVEYVEAVMDGTRSAAILLRTEV